MPKTISNLAVFPGTFDPLTHGHLDIVVRAGRLFKEVVVAVGQNPEKAPWFTPVERVEMIREAIGAMANVSIESYDGLTMDFVRSIGAGVLIRGIRDSVDLREELQIASLNRMVGEVETVFLMTDEKHALTSSTLIKQIVELGAFDEDRLSRLVPPTVIEAIRLRVVNGAVPN